MEPFLTRRLLQQSEMCEVTFLGVTQERPSVTGSHTAIPSAVHRRESLGIQRLELTDVARSRKDAPFKRCYEGVQEPASFGAG